MSGARLSRRAVLAALAAAPLLAAAARPAAAGEESLAAALQELGITAGAIRWDAGLALSGPALAEDGAAVPVTVRLADGPDGRVTDIFIFAPANRRALVARLMPGAAAGRAGFSLRIRLARSQTVSAVARFANGVLLGARTEIQVTAGGGCRT